MISETATVVLVTLVVYKIVLIGIGFWAASRNRSESDFFLGGRQLGPFVAGLSYAASTSSAWALLGFSGFVYAVGLSALWMVPGIWAGYAVVWFYFGPQLRKQSLEFNQVTLTDFLLQDSGRVDRRAAAFLSVILILLCFIFYIAAQFDAAGKALVSHFDLSETTAIVAGAMIVFVYSMLGGFWAVSVTDTLQALVMMVAALLVPVAAVTAGGGFAEIWSGLETTMPASYLQISGGHSWLILVGFIVGTAGTSLGTFGQPQLLSRLMAIKGDRERIQGAFIAITWGVAVYVGMVALALSGRVLMPDLASGEMVFYQTAADYLPTVLAGIVIAATLSAVMSTVDSILLAASGAVAHDMGVNAKFPDRKVLASRVVMSGIAAMAVILTLALPDTIFNRVLFAWSALGAAFGPVVLWRVMGKVVTGRGAFWAMLTGFMTTVLFYWYGAEPESTHLVSVLAHLPGDPFERAFPWLPPLMVLFSHLNRSTKTTESQTAMN